MCLLEHQEHSKLTQYKLLSLENKVESLYKNFNSTYAKKIIDLINTS